MTKKKKAGKFTKEQLNDLQGQEQQKTQEKEVRGTQIINLSNYPDIKFYKPKDGSKNKINIIPWVLTTNNSTNGLKKGKLDHIVDYHMHFISGPSGNHRIICPNRFNGGKCPICEDYARQRKNGSSKEDVQDLFPKHRVMYQLQDKNKPENGVQLFDISFNCFEAELREDRKEHQDDNGSISIAHPIDGKTIKVKAIEVNGDGTNGGVFDSFEMKSPMKN